MRWPHCLLLIQAEYWSMQSRLLLVMYSLPAGKAYKSGDTLGFVLNFSEPVILTIKTDTPVIKLTIELKRKTLFTARVRAQAPLTFNYIIQPTDVDKNGLSIGSSILLYNSMLSDQAGNIAVANFN